MNFQIGSGYSYNISFTQLDFDRFARLSGDDNPIHVDHDYAANTKFGKTVAHGMLLYSAISKCLSEQFPANIHFSVNLKFPQPTFASQQLSITQKITNKSPNSDWLEVSSQVLQSDGSSGCNSLITLSNTPQYHAKGIEHGESRPPLAADDQVLKGLKTGQTAGINRIFSQSDINEYIDITGDFNQLHKNYDFVRTNGFDNLVVPTPLIGGIFSKLLGTDLPGRGTNWLKLSLNFLAPAYLEEKISTKVTIARIRADKELVNLDLTALGRADRVLCQGEALVLVKDVASR